MTEQNSLDKFRSKEVEERFQELISGVVNEEFENMTSNDLGGIIYDNPDFKCPKCDGKLSVGQADLD